MAMQPLIQIQQTMAEIGRIRIGEKSEKGAPRKLTTFRLTSASKSALDAAEKLYGGTVRPWVGAPNEGTFELLTTVSELPVAIPPIPTLCSQYYEMWAAGGCTRRCDGETELLSGDSCQCDPDDDPKNRCKITTRVSVMLPQLPGLGLWRLESHGWNAAKTLPGTLRLLAGSGKFIPASIRLEQRTEKKDNQTRKFVVPVIDLPTMTMGAFIEGSGALMLGGPALEERAKRVDRPALPDATDLPNENPDWNGGEKRSEQFLKIMGALEATPGPQVHTFKKKMDTAIGKLPEHERQLVFEKINERADLPF